MSVERNRRREADLKELTNLPRAEALRIAMIKYQWGAQTAAQKVDMLRGRHLGKPAEPPDLRST